MQKETSSASTLEKDKKELVNSITEELKTDILAELDKRLKETEKSLSENMGEYIHEELEGQMESVIESQVAGQHKKTRNKIGEDLKKFQNNLELYHRIPYAFLAISGVMLFWFGAWKILWSVFAYDNGLIPLTAGLILLLVTGRITKAFLS